MTESDLDPEMIKTLLSCIENNANKLFLGVYRHSGERYIVGYILQKDSDINKEKYPIMHTLDRIYWLNVKSETDYEPLIPKSLEESAFWFNTLCEGRIAGIVELCGEMYPQIT